MVSKIDIEASISYEDDDLAPADSFLKFGSEE